MKRLTLAAVVLAGTAVLAGCSATPYRKGYGEVQLSPTSFQIRTMVNGFSPRSRAEDIAMLRASEIACFGKFDSFDVTEKSIFDDRQMTHATITIELKHGDGQYDAAFLMNSIGQRIDAETSCRF